MVDDKVQPIGISCREPGKTMFEIIERQPGDCFEHAYLIDRERGNVTCKECKKQFDPLVVLVDLARKESRWMRNLNDYTERMERLDARRKTTCEHCKQMTRIKGE